MAEAQFAPPCFAHTVLTTDQAALSGPIRPLHARPPDSLLARLSTVSRTFKAVRQQHYVYDWEVDHTQHSTVAVIYDDGTMFAVTL